MLPREKVIYLSLGSNLGDRAGHLAAAISFLLESGIGVAKLSHVYETEPRDVPDQPWFLNQVVECTTRLDPQSLLAVVQEVEKHGGRTRETEARRGPRVIDIDILLFDDLLIDALNLQVPHPRLTERRFVLEPLLELRGDIVDPRSKLPLSACLAKVRDQRVDRLY